MTDRKDTISPDEKRLQACVEAILFTMGKAVALGKIADALELDHDRTREIIENMMSEYDREDRGIRLIELDGSYQLCTKKEYYELLIRIAKQPQKITLTDTVLETLAIIAYKQPVTRIEIEKIRGVKSDHAVNKLIEYELVTELGRLDAPGRPILFGTTEEFLRHFGVRSLDELPALNPLKMEDFKSEAEEEVELRLKV